MQLPVLSTEYTAGTTGDLHNSGFHAVTGEKAPDPFPVGATDGSYGLALNDYGNFLALNLQLGRQRVKCVGIEIFSSDLPGDNRLAIR